MAAISSFAAGLPLKCWCSTFRAHGLRNDEYSQQQRRRTGRANAAGWRCPGCSAGADASEDTAGTNVAVVCRCLAHQFSRGQTLHAGRGSAAHRSVHALQGRGRQAQRAVDLQPGRDPQRPLRDAGDVSAGGGSKCRRRQAQPKAARGMPRRGPPRTSVNFITTLPAFVDPGLEEFLIDNGVEISAEPIDGGRQRAGDAALRLRSGAAADRVLRLDLPPRRAAGRRPRRRADGDRQEQGAPLRPGAGYEGHVRRRRRHRRSRERAGRDRRLPARPAEVHAARRHRAEGRAAGRRAGHRQDAARARPSPARPACRSSR